MTKQTDLVQHVLTQTGSSKIEIKSWLARYAKTHGKQAAKDLKCKIDMELNKRDFELKKELYGEAK